MSVQKWHVVRLGEDSWAVICDRFTATDAEVAANFIARACNAEQKRWDEADDTYREAAAYKAALPRFVAALEAFMLKRAYK